MRVRAVEVGCLRRELPGAGIDAAIDRGDARAHPSAAHGDRRHARQLRDLGVAEARALGLDERRADDGPLGLDQLGEAFGEPWGHAGGRRQPGGIGPAMSQQRDHAPQARVGGGQEAGDVVRGAIAELPGGVLPQPAAAARLERADRLQQGGAELAIDAHRLAGGLHLHAERAVGTRELVERPARQLDDDVVDRRLEGGTVAAGGRVRHLVEPLAERDERRDARDRVAGRLGGQRRRARYARIDLDDAVVGAVRRDRQLHVAAALQLQRAHDLQRAAPQPLDDRIRQGLDGRDHDRVAGVHAHRVEVLHAADRDGGVRGVAQHFELDLLPAQQAALDQHLADGAGGQAMTDAEASLVRRVGESPAAAAERERRADDHCGAELLDEAHPVLDALDHRALGHRLTDSGHQVAEATSVLRGADGGQRRAEHTHAEALQHAGVVERHRQVQPGLAAERGEQRIRSVPLDHAGQVLERQRTDDHRSADVRIGHHRRGIGVDQDGLHAFATQRQAGLHPGVVELGGLADEDRPGADDQHAARAHAGTRSICGSAANSIGTASATGANIAK